jgi:hypothetical protein
VARTTVAEASHPTREVRKKIKAEPCKSSGAKKKKVHRPAKHVNWSTLFAWCGSGRRGGEETGGCLLVVGWAVGRHLGRVLAVDTTSFLGRHVHGGSPCGVRQLIRSFLPQWHAITDAQKKVSWSPTTIIQELRQVNNGFFQYFTKQTLREWIEDLGGFKCWKLSAVARTLKGNIPDHNKGGRSAILV